LQRGDHRRSLEDESRFSRDGPGAGVYSSAPEELLHDFANPRRARAQAPGRVNLIGEHTDYNGGLVMPVAIPRRTRVELTLRGGRTAKIRSEAFPGDGALEYEIGEETPGRGWLDYVQGITWALAREGIAVPGFEARIASTVPPGSGLASSASLEVALLRALRELLGLSLSGLEIARIAHRAETAFVGAPVGVMDPMACSLGTESAAMRIDTRILDIEIVTLPAPLELGVLDSGVRHSHAAGEYRVRRAECEEAARRLGVESLRELEGSPSAAWEKLPDPLPRRVRHVLAENERVLRTVEALRAGEIASLADLFEASHRSLRDDFEVSIPELDLLVELARAEKEILGARMTGGGFGGSVVILGRAGETLDAARRILRAYRNRTGRAGEVLLPLDPDRAVGPAEGLPSGLS
jgi:galactokinase